MGYYIEAFHIRTLMKDIMEAHTSLFELKEVQERFEEILRKQEFISYEQNCNKFVAERERKRIQWIQS